MRRFDYTVARVITLMGRFSLQVRQDEDAEEVALEYIKQCPQGIEWAPARDVHGSDIELVETQEYIPYPWEPIIHAIHAHHQTAQPVQSTIGHSP